MEVTPTVREGPGMARILKKTLRPSSLGPQRKEMCRGNLKYIRADSHEDRNVQTPTVQEGQGMARILFNTLLLSSLDCRGNL